MHVTRLLGYSSTFHYQEHQLVLDLNMEIVLHQN